MELPYYSTILVLDILPSAMMGSSVTNFESQKHGASQFVTLFPFLNIIFTFLDNCYPIFFSISIEIW